MQIWTKCLVLKKVKIILFFGSEKLKKCTDNFHHHDFPNYANFEGYSILNLILSHIVDISNV